MTVRLYRYFSRHKVLLWTLLVASSVFFLCFGLRMEYLEDVSSLVPNPGKGESGLAFNSLKVKDKIFFQFPSATPDQVDAFMEGLLQKDSTIANVLYKIESSVALEALDFALDHGILESVPTDLNAAATRLELARMLAAALVRRALPGALFDSAKVFEDGDAENRKGHDYWYARILGTLVEQLRLARRLRDVHSLRRDVLEPAVRELCRTRAVTRDETRALEIALEKPEISAQDLSGIWADQFLRSRSIRKMLEAGFLRPVREGARKYTLNFSNFALVKF